MGGRHLTTIVGPSLGCHGGPECLPPLRRVPREAHLCSLILLQMCICSRQRHKNFASITSSYMYFIIWEAQHGSYVLGSLLMSFLSRKEKNNNMSGENQGVLRPLKGNLVNTPHFSEVETEVQGWHDFRITVTDLHRDKKFYSMGAVPGAADKV